MIIEVVEYRLPNGQRIPQQLEVNDKYEEIYKEIQSNELELTAELLRTGQISITVTNENCGDFLIEIVKNDNSLDTHFEELLDKWDSVKYQVWLRLCDESEWD
jgi:hypothetical protein